MINWYQCSDGTTQDCDGDTNTLVADATDTLPPLCVWYTDDDEQWHWAARVDVGLPPLCEMKYFTSCSSARRYAERWAERKYGV